ncbi:MAG: YIP1 family protein [Anaerolineales bacterium]
MFKRLFKMLRNPDEFFEGVRDEGGLQSFIFFLQVSVIIAVFTPIVNYLGWVSNDQSAAFQAQIIAWKITDEQLLSVLGGWAYVVEVFLILALSLLVLLFMTGFLHLIFRLLGGKGPILNAWKAACYGTGPCVLLGWIPYWSPFVAVWSLLLQFYYGPKILYRMKEGRALIILVCILGATFLELMIKGTTVGF